MLKPDYEAEAEELDNMHMETRKKKKSKGRSKRRQKFLAQLLGCPRCGSVFELNNVSVQGFRSLQLDTPVERAPLGAMQTKSAGDGFLSASSAAGVPYRCCHDKCLHAVYVHTPTARATAGDAQLPLTLMCSAGVASAAHAHLLQWCAACDAWTLALHSAAQRAGGCVGCSGPLVQRPPAGDSGAA